MKKEKSKLYYAGIFVFSLVLFSMEGPARRWITLPSTSLAAFRAFIGAVFLGIVIAVMKKSAFAGLTKKQLIVLAVSGVALGVNWALLFEAFNHTTIACATLCSYMEPVFVIIASVPILKEKLTLRKTLCCLCAVFGLILACDIMGERLGEGDIKGILFGLGSGLLYAAAVILNKIAGKTDAMAKTFIQLAAASAVLVPYSMITEWNEIVSMDLRSVLLTLVVGIFMTGFAYIFFFGGIDGLKAQTVALLSYLDPVLAIIAAALIIGEVPSLLQIIGAVIIILSLSVGEFELPEKKIK